MTYRILTATAMMMAAASVAGESRAQSQDVAHPFLLWTREEAKDLRQRIESDPVAKGQYERMASTDISRVNPTMWNLFNYLVMGDEQAGEREKGELLKFIGQVPAPLRPGFEEDMQKAIEERGSIWTIGGPSHWDRHMRDEQTLNTLRYDVLYDRLTPAQRKGVQTALRAYIDFHLSGHKPWHPDFKYNRTGWLPNMHWPRAIGTHLMAAALRDEKLIEAMFNSEGGWKWYFDEYIADERFYMEEFAKYYSNIGTMLMYCEALERLGLGRFGYDYTGTGGANMRKYLEMTYWIGFPRLDAGPGANVYQAVTMGDAGEPRLVDNTRRLTWWTTSHMNGPLPKLAIPGWFEIGHRRWPDAGFDYFLAQMRQPDEEVYLPSLYWGLGPIDPQKVTPPPAPSYVARERGFAFLRAEESPAYWESPAPAVALQFAMYYVHYVHDCFSILGYVANNRQLYWRMGEGTKRGYAGGDQWRDHVRGQAGGVVVDGLKARWVDNGNEGTPNHRIREHLAPAAKFVAVRARDVYPGVDQERALVLPREYLLDVFWLKSDTPRAYDWHVHALAHVADLPGSGWRKTDKLAGEHPGQRHISSETLQHIHLREVGDRPWSVDLVQKRVGEPGPKGDLPTEWYERGVGVRLSMLGESGSFVHAAKPNGFKPEQLGSTVLVARHKPATTFVALHEPFEGGAGKHRIQQFDRIAQTDAALGVRIAGQGINDRVLLAIAEGAGAEQTVTGDGESFTFTDFALVRAGGQSVEVTGQLRAMRLKVDGKPSLVVNGQRVPAAVEGGFLVLK
jgi:hypothetical protein